jgi:hypothetical protein
VSVSCWTISSAVAALPCQYLTLRSIRSWDREISAMTTIVRASHATMNPVTKQASAKIVIKAPTWDKTMVPRSERRIGSQPAWL